MKSHASTPQIILQIRTKDCTFELLSKIRESAIDAYFCTRGFSRRSCRLRDPEDSEEIESSALMPAPPR